MELFDLDVAQAVAQLVKVSKQQNDSMEAAAHWCVTASLGADRRPGAPEPAGDKANQRRVSTEWVSHGIRAAVA
jgi:hypothetical protein